jgi:SNF2 family DNA or RNA helicase
MRTYGSVKLVGNDWVIEAEPHVVIRLKRMFGRAAKGATKLKLRHTLDVARDIDWILSRYPMEVSEQNAAFLRGQTDAHQERSERFFRLLSGSAEARLFELKLPPRDYQRTAAELALSQPGLLIADEVGVGKTVQAICMFTDPATRPALVVTLTHLPMQWARELNRFAPRISFHVLKKASPYQLPPVDVIITNYHKLAGWAPALSGQVRCVVFDEVQELRHSGTARYEAATSIALGAAHRVGLSATPIHNYGDEFYNVMNVLRPGELGERDEFIREWCGGADSRGRARLNDPSAFGTYLRDQGMMIRRTRRDVGRELPELTVVPHTVPSEDVLDKLEGVTELAQYILSRSGAGIEQMQARGELDWKLRQATGIAKAKFVAEFVRILVDSGERVLLYGWHHAVYDIWADQLQRAGIACVRFTGEESAAQKERAKDDFVAGRSQVLIMSLRAGAGLDGLQHACSTVVFGELDWSPSVHEQATGRVFRDGQQSPVMAYYLVSEDGSDPVLQSALGIKRHQLDGVRKLDAAREVGETVKRDGVLELAKLVLKRHGVEEPEVAQ